MESGLEFEPFKLDTILAPVELSDCSARAIAYAIPFARHFHCKLVFLHVCPRFEMLFEGHAMSGPSAGVSEEIRKQDDEQMRSWLESLLPPDLEPILIVRQGTPSLTIIEAAKEVGADLVIMSTHGHIGRAHSMKGSVAADVSRLAHCPVLVVREKEKKFVSQKTCGWNPDQK